jgi:hypothetical protein
MNAVKAFFTHPATMGFFGGAAAFTGAYAVNMYRKGRKKAEKHIKGAAEHCVAMFS